ncbi:MFS transporter [Microbacterium sp.]|uniref:MFS transporter n=1 Tax=Microbacterium sp. TaxID=51671 RepID=UPI0039E354D9
MTQIPEPEGSRLVDIVGFAYFAIAFIARLPFAMMVVGVLTLTVSVRGSISLGGLTSAAVGVGTACFGPLLGAAADRFGQRRVLSALALANGAMLVLFTLVVSASDADALVLLSAFGIGATAPQVAPMSRSRLVTAITERMPAARHPKAISATMAYESAADETVFVFGPFLVGILASFIAPWAPLVIAAALTVLFVGAFALHPTARAISTHRDADGRAPSPASALLSPGLLVVVLGVVGVGMFFGTMLTSLTSFMADRGEPEQAGVLYGVMGVGSAALALGVAWLPPRFSMRARWLVFASVLFAGTLLLPFVDTPAMMMLALGIMGIGIGPTLVTQYSLGAARSPLGRSATVMTMLGSGTVVGQSLGAAVGGWVSEQAGTSTALLLPVVAAGIALLGAILNRPLSASGLTRAA